MCTHFILTTEKYEDFKILILQHLVLMINKI